jgi:hypothetical protein
VRAARFLTGAPGKAAALLAALIITAAAVFYLSRADSVEPGSKLYAYGVGERFEFSENATLRMRETGAVVSDGPAAEYPLGHGPVFYSDEARAILTAPMSAVSRTGTQGGVPYFSEVCLTEDGPVIDIGGEAVPTDGGFLFDGRDLYVFLDGGEIVVGTESYSITPLSCVTAVRGARVEIYVYGAEKGIMLSCGDADITALTDGGYSVDMGKDILRSDGEELLLFTYPGMFAPLSPFTQ